jgi:hypothetical protein
MFPSRLARRRRPHHVDCYLPEAHRQRLGEILDALMSNNARLASGHRVTSAPKALMYLIETGSVIGNELPVGIEPPNA